MNSKTLTVKGEKVEVKEKLLDFDLKLNAEAIV